MVEQVFQNVYDTAKLTLNAGYNLKSPESTDFSTETYVMGAQKNRLIEHPKHMFKLTNKKMMKID